MEGATAGPAEAADSKEAGAVSESDRLARLLRALASDEEKLERLQQERKTKTEQFDELNQLRETLVVRLEELKEQLTTVDDPEKRSEIAGEIETIESDTILARKQTDILLAAAKTLKEQVGSLERKIEIDRAAIDVLNGEESPPAPYAPAAEVPAAAPAPAAPQAAAPGFPMSPTRFVPNAGQGAPTPQPGVPMKETAAQIEARIAAERMEQKALAAEREIVSFLDRKQALEQQIELEKKLIESTENSVANVKDAVEQKRKAYEAAVAADESPEVLGEQKEMLERLEAALSEERKILNGRLDELEDLEERLRDAEQYQETVTETAAEKRLEAQEARKRSIWLDSPLHPENIGKWLVERVPRILLVAVVAGVLLLLTRLTARRVAGVMVRPGQRRRGESAKRADTLALSMRSATTGLILVGAVLLMLQEAGINVKTVLGGAAIFGFAIAFGAQNLMRDYFNGFMILIEDQYELNDLLTIGDVTGRVEHLNLRTTVLRDLGGRVHFIPNGEIKSVTNHTYEWSRAVIEICVGFSEDVDRVMDLLVEIADELRADEKFDGYVTEPAEMLGVDRFTDFGPVIRFLLKTKADRMFVVKREMQRRVKNRFEQLGIELKDPNRIALQRPNS
jgi:small conductance mechanosensitive channel